MEEIRENEFGDKPFAERFTIFANNAVSIAPLIAALLIAFWWIFFGTIKILNQEISITKQIGLAIITVAMAMTYRKLISNGGFEDGHKNTNYKNVRDEWEITCKNNIGSRSMINEFVKDKCYDNLRYIRKLNLEKNGLVYNKIFNDLNQLIAIDYKKNKYNKKTNKDGYTFWQRHIIKKCVKMKVYIPDVFTIEKNRYLGLKKRETEREYKLKNDTISFVITSVLAFFSTSVMFAWVGFSKGSWIFALFQIALWTGTGVVQRIKNYNHVVKKEYNDIKDNNDTIKEYEKLPEDMKEHYKQIVEEKENKKFKLLVPGTDEN